MKNILLLHGFKSSSQSYFLPDLAKRYASENVCAPDCPTPDKPHIDAWTDAVLAFGQKDFDLIVAHSLGGTLALSMLSRGLMTAKTLITIGSSHGPKENKDMNTFLQYSIDFDGIKNAGTQMIVVQSFDDPWTHPEYGTLLVKQGGGHGLFFADKGHFELSVLPEEILRAIEVALRT